jgi:hypothetical protein
MSVSTSDTFKTSNRKRAARRMMKQTRGTGRVNLPALYENAVEINPTTGEPADYLSAFVGYRKLTLSIANKLNIPFDQQEDAVQEVQLRFWLRDSLAKYDPNRVWENDQGQRGTAKFGSMYRSFVGLSMLAERDKHINYSRRNQPTPNDEIPSPIPEADIADGVTEQDAAQRWVSIAHRALLEADRADLVPVLNLCQQAAVLATVVTRADVVAATGCRLRAATTLLKELRETLEAAGMGPESLTDG